MQRNPMRFAAMWRALQQVPRRPPGWLERAAAFGLGATPEDHRLGDLSERYLQTYALASGRLGSAAWARAAARIAGDLAYLAGAGNVVLFARTVDPGLRLAERGAGAFVALDLRERTMALLRAAAAGRLVLPTLLLVGGALLVSGAVDIWHSWRQSEAQVARLQRERAESAAARIEQFFAATQRQIGWVTGPQWASGTLDWRRADYARLLRQVPEITEVAQLDDAGIERLRVSRLAKDKVDSGADFSQDPRFVTAKAGARYVSPVYFRRDTEPYLSLAVPHPGAVSGTTLVELNLKPVWDVIRTTRIGDAGYAYVVDDRGRLVAHPDMSVVLRGTDLSTLPQVIAARAARAAEPAGVAAFDSSPSGVAVLSTHAAIPSLGWRVFVELPAAEARAPLWGALARIAGMLVLGVAAALLASVAATRRGGPARPAQA